MLFTDPKNRLVGICTDGDLRKSILQGANTTSEVSQIMNRNPITTNEVSDYTHVKNIMREYQISQIPLLDTNNNFSRIIFDSWIEARFPKPLEALKTLYQATKIRSMWQKFLTAKLLEQDNVDSERMQDQLGTIHILRKHLYSTKLNLTP